jgi:hypothetical protein
MAFPAVLAFFVCRGVFVLRPAFPAPYFLCATRGFVVFNSVVAALSLRCCLARSGVFLDAWD